MRKHPTSRVRRAPAEQREEGGGGCRGPVPHVTAPCRTMPAKATATPGILPPTAPPAGAPASVSSPSFVSSLFFPNVDLP